MSDPVTTAYLSVKQVGALSTLQHLSATAEVKKGSNYLYLVGPQRISTTVLVDRGYCCMVY